MKIGQLEDEIFLNENLEILVNLYNLEIIDENRLSIKLYWLILLVFVSRFIFNFILLLINYYCYLKIKYKLK